jgi:hypothetical protein
MSMSNDDKAKRIRQLTYQRDALSDIPLEKWMGEYAESLEPGLKRSELLAAAHNLKAGIDQARAWIDDEIKRLAGPG